MVRKALVIGVDQYKQPIIRPQYSLKDAEEIARLLRTFGDFDEIRVLLNGVEQSETNLGEKEPEDLKNSIRELFNPQDHTTDTALLYFSGNGVGIFGAEGLANQKGDLLLDDPESADDDPESAESSLKPEFRSISLEWLHDLLQESSVKHQIVWLDSDFSDRFISLFSSSSTDSKFDRCLIAATSSYAVESSGHGALTTALLQCLNPVRQVKDSIDSSSLKASLEKTFNWPIALLKNIGDPISLTFDPTSALLVKMRDAASRSRLVDQIQEELSSEIDFVPDSATTDGVGLSFSRKEVPLQKLWNDLAEGEDYLSIQNEVYALADMLLLEELEPPLTVGILGGWGSGKSYIMHLMQQRMVEIRGSSHKHGWGQYNSESKKYEKTPGNFVGHVYQIKFDAWTFAKADLWASLMYTIFFELNRQISLEQKLQVLFKKNGIDEDHGIWEILYKTNEEDCNYFQKILQNLKPETLKNLQKVLKDSQKDEQIEIRLNIAENLLWNEFRKNKEEKLEELEDKKASLQVLQVKRVTLEQEIQRGKENLDKQTHLTLSELNQQFRKAPTSRLVAEIQKALGASEWALRKWLGEEGFEGLQSEITKSMPNMGIEDPIAFSTEVQKAVVAVANQGSSFHFSAQAIKQWAYTNLAFLVMFAVFALLSVLLPLRVAQIYSAALIPQIIACITPLLPAIGMAQKLWHSAQRWNRQARQALDDYAQKVEADSRQYVEQQIQQGRERPQIQRQQAFIATLEQDVREINIQEQQVQLEIQNIQKELPENLPASLAAYLANQMQAGIYDKRLGLMHQVKQHLTDLSHRLLPPSVSIETEEFQHRIQNLKEVFPRGPARVVLYIDDLDRCPPDQVVAVLEAVQLLVKNPLFIAVIAIDERYITRALEKRYEGILIRRGQPSGTDYLEKIIQVPYRVRPIIRSALENYLNKQMGIDPSTSSKERKLINLSEDASKEVEALQRCCQKIELSPRMIKRLVNIYKIFKVRDQLENQVGRTSPEQRQAILSVLALSARYPDFLREVFRKLEMQFEQIESLGDNVKALKNKLEQLKGSKAEGRTDLATEIKLEEILKTKEIEFNQQKQELDKKKILTFFLNLPSRKGNIHLQQEYDRLQLDATALLEEVSLAEFDSNIFNRVRSYCFFGDTGYNPQDFQRTYFPSILIGDIESQNR